MWENILNFIVQVFMGVYPQDIRLDVIWDVFFVGLAGREIFQNNMENTVASQ